MNSAKRNESEMIIDNLKQGYFLKNQADTMSKFLITIDIIRE
jgi:hypothetical protein